MRVVLTGAVTTTATVKRPGVRTSDGRGGWTQTYATAATETVHFEEVPNQTVIEGIIAEQLKGRQAFYCHFKASTDIRYEDRIVISGVEYEVMEIVAPLSLEVMRRVMVAPA